MKTLFTLLLCMLVSQTLHAADSTASFAEFDRKAKAGDPLSVVFFGGSLTYGANASNPDVTSWRGLMMDYLRKKYPRTPFTFHDAAIGGTGSKLGMFRLERDVLSKKPDLVFYDFTVNDGPGDDIESLASYEGILRKMISAGIPVEQEFFTFKFYHAPEAYTQPRYIAHKKLADAYHTATGDVMYSICELVHSGKVTEDKIWPADGAHPYDYGYTLFFEPIRDGFEKAIADGRVCTVPKDPVFSDKYSKVTRTILVDGTLPKGWRQKTTYRTSLWYDGLPSRWMTDMAVCGGKEKGQAKVITDIDPLKIDFTGTFVGIFGEKSGIGLSFKVVIDGKPVPYVIENKKDGDVSYDAWPDNLRTVTKGDPASHLFSWIQIADKLPPGKHTLEIMPVLDPDNADGELHIESICTAGE